MVVDGDFVRADGLAKRNRDSRLGVVRGDPIAMPTTRLSLRIMPLLLAMASLLAYGSATPASAGITRGSLAWESSLGQASSSSVDPCLVGRWVSTKMGGLAATGSGLAKMQLAILANGHATLNLTGSTPFVVPSLKVSNSFVGTEVFRIASSHTATGDAFSIFPSHQHITETIVFAGTKQTKALSEGFFDAANYSCGSTRLRTDFNLSQGGVYLHGFVATFKKL
jgi:hypothetical protein